MRAVARRRQLLTANLSGDAFLLFVLYALFVLNGAAPNIVDTLIVMVPTSFFLCWLQATTFAAFYPDQSEIPYIPTLRRLHHFIPWALAVVGTVVLCGWLSSALGAWVWLAGAGCVLALLPLAAQAAGGWFDRSVAIDVISNPKYWILAVTVIFAGLCLPFLLLTSLSLREDFVAYMLIQGLCIGIGYVLAVTAWVTIAALIGEFAAGASTPKRFQGEDIARLSEGVSGELQSVTPKRSFSRNAITMEKTRNHTSQ